MSNDKAFSGLLDHPAGRRHSRPDRDSASVGKDVIGKLHGEIVKLLHQNDVKEKIAFVGAETVGDSPEEFGAFIRSEAAKYAKIIKEAISKSIKAGRT